MYDKKRLSLAVSTALGLSSLLMISGQVMAQDQAEDEDDLMLEEVVVTGSRLISQDGFGRTSPVTVVGMEAIASTGLTRMEDVLNNLPSVQADETGFDSNGATGTGSVDLRGLGTNRTVVLVNGRPMTINWADKNVPAILEAWFPGEFGGDAIAETLFGDYNPGGKLPIELPSSMEAVRAQKEDVPYDSENPLFAFGFGLNYE